MFFGSIAAAPLINGLMQPRHTRRSAACAVDSHPVCPHLMGFRLAGEWLCWCPCHDACRYTGTVNVTLDEWWDSCTCPGSDRMREESRRRWGQARPPTLEEVQRASRADDRAWNEVEAAVEARGQPPYLVDRDYSLPMADVALDPATTAILGQLGKAGLVSLERDPEGQVAAYWVRQRLGTLSQEDGARYQPALDAAQRRGCSLMVWSKLTGQQDGTPRLQVYPAGIL